MILRVLNHKFHYEMENLCRIFYPYEKIKVVYDNDGEDDICVSTSMDGEYNIAVYVTINGITKSATVSTDNFDECELEMATLLFNLLTEFTGYVPKWGVLTGVRPSKLLFAVMNQYGEEQGMEYFTKKLLVTEPKAQLAYNVAKAEERIMAVSQRNSFSLYISIPFCPTRCNYCSFVSHSVAQAQKIIPEYVENLCREIRLTGEIAKKIGLRLESVYWGGGTPTTLSAEQISKICKEIEENFDLSTVREYTIEAGRADTVTAEKLDVIKAAGVGRISINPQTFNDDVLKAIGRKHTVADVINVYNLARQKGFNNINMDLIAGLTTDTFDSFCNSIDSAINLNPENITLHTLALKRSSNIVKGGVDVESGETANKMLEYAQNQFYSNGYLPYYMYRQSRSLGNLENVGWCHDGYECIYNVFMMEECHTVLAVGAGAVTKLRNPDSTNLERIFNYKYPYEYNSGFDTMAERKKQIEEFYRSIF